MQTQKVRNTFIILIGLVFIFACTSKTIQPPAVPPSTDTISFSKDLLPVFTGSCATSAACHATGGHAPDLSAANAYSAIVPAYINTGNPSASEIYTVVKPGGIMGSYYPSGKDPNEILYWIQQGAKNN
jgi:hypothetical protein